MKHIPLLLPLFLAGALLACRSEAPAPEAPPPMPAEAAPAAASALPEVRYYLVADT